MSAGVEPLALAIFVIGAVLAAGAAALLLRVRTLARRLAAAGGDPSLLARVAKMDRSIDASAGRLDQLSARVEQLSAQTARCVQRVGVVRYDAFQELGGHLSFTVALLDAKQDGVVLSVLNNRDGARAYAKPVAGGRSTVTLSEEEERAISQA
jgi:hypothetical protein